MSTVPSSALDVIESSRGGIGVSESSGLWRRLIRKPLAVACMLYLAIIVGILYLVAGNSLPSFLTAGSHVHKGNHLARGGVALVVGVACLIGAWFSSKTKSSS